MVVTALCADGEPYFEELSNDFYSSECYAEKSIENFGNRTPEDQKKLLFAYLPTSAPHWRIHAADGEIAK